MMALSLLSCTPPLFTAPRMVTQRNYYLGDGLLGGVWGSFEFAVKRLASSPNYDDFSPEDQEVMGLAQEFASGLRPKRWFRG